MKKIIVLLALAIGSATLTVPAMAQVHHPVHHRHHCRHGHHCHHIHH